MPLQSGMRHTLRAHPESSCFAVKHLEVEVARPQARNLVFAYALTGRIDDLAMPARAAAVRSDALWRHTCFEAFLGTSLDPAYYEFNFAPSTQWAAYRFSRYRTGMRVATEISVPTMAVESTSDRYILRVSLDLGQALLAEGAMWRLGISAVIEEIGGNRSYWALAHPAGKADFHHSSCFTLEV
jgi:hypothetical protein